LLAQFEVGDVAVLASDFEKELRSVSAELGEEPDERLTFGTRR
jgi:hypothetical protein